MADLTIEEIKVFLREHADTKKEVKIDRKFDSSTSINGFIHAVSYELVLIQQFDDFYPDGYSIIRIEDIVGFRSDDVERMFEKILHGEGLLDQVKYDRKVPLEQFGLSLGYFADCGEIIIIESESVEDPDDDLFYFGKVMSINNEVAVVRHADTLGIWEEDEVNIELKNITRVQFETPYINVLSKYTN